MTDWFKSKMLSSGYFYEHMDGSVCCRKCARTLEEGCDCYFITIKPKGRQKPLPETPSQS